MQDELIHCQKTVDTKELQLSRTKTLYLETNPNAAAEAEYLEEIENLEKLLYQTQVRLAV